MKVFFETIDIFPHRMNFNFKRKTNFHTKSGFILSVLAYVILFFCFYKFSEDCFRKQNHRLSIKEKLFIND